MFAATAPVDVDAAKAINNASVNHDIDDLFTDHDICDIMSSDDPNGDTNGDPYGDPYGDHTRMVTEVIDDASDDESNDDDGFAPRLLYADSKVANVAQVANAAKVPKAGKVPQAGKVKVDNVLNVTAGSPGCKGQGRLAASTSLRLLNDEEFDRLAKMLLNHIQLFSVADLPSDIKRKQHAKVLKTRLSGDGGLALIRVYLSRYQCGYAPKLGRNGEFVVHLKGKTEKEKSSADAAREILRMLALNIDAPMEDAATVQTHRRSLLTKRRKAETDASSPSGRSVTLGEVKTAVEALKESPEGLSFSSMQTLIEIQEALQQVIELWRQSRPDATKMPLA
jgi:hypothetical protein